MPKVTRAVGPAKSVARRRARTWAPLTPRPRRGRSAICSGRSMRVAGPSRPLATGTRPRRQLGDAAREHRVEDDGLAEERGGLRVGRGEVDLARRAGLAQPAAAQDDELVGEAHRLLLVVGDEDRGDAGRARGCRRSPCASARAGRRRAPRTARRAASAAAAAPAPGRAPRAAAGRRRARAAAARPSRGRARRDPSARARAPAPSRCRASMPKRMLSSTLRCGNSAPSCITRPMLRRCARHRGRGVGDQRAVEADLARVGRLEAGDEPQQRGLARAGGADDGGARPRPRSRSMPGSAATPPKRLPRPRRPSALIGRSPRAPGGRG